MTSEYYWEEYMKHMSGNYGWVCPVCGRVNAPWNPCCRCNGRKNDTIKVSTGTGSVFYQTPDIKGGTEEAEEIVRCKDCKHSKDTGDYQDTYFCTSRTHAQDFLVHSLDYCSYGERKE